MADQLDEIDDLDDGEEGDEEGGERSSGGGKKKLFIIIGLVVLLLIGAAAAAYFTGLLDPLLGDEESAASGAPSGGQSGTAVFYEVPEMLVNLNTGGRKSTLLKIRVSLELGKQEDVSKIIAILPRIIDNFQVYLRELRIEDLQGSAGMYRLREELLTRVNVAAHPTKINAVLFKEMLVQ